MARQCAKLFRFFLLISFFGLYSCSSVDSDSENSKTPDAINSKLVKIENDIYIAMSAGDTKKALVMVGQLNHPSDVKWSSKSNLFKWKFYTYNEWWNERRESLRKEILDMAALNKSKKSSQENKVNNQQTTSSDQPNTDSGALQGTEMKGTLSFSDRYYGLYTFQSANGDTQQLYKFSKNSSNNDVNIIYQDNIGGNAKIETYIVKSFREDTGELLLESKKDNKEIVAIFFKSDSKSANGFKLVDAQGNSYDFVPN